MSNFEEQNINKTFNELMASASIKDANELKNEQLITDPKELLSIQESLMDSLMSVNSLLYGIVSDLDFEIGKNTTELLEKLYKASEDFFSHINEICATMALQEGSEIGSEEGLEDEDDDELW